jgi:hypothetical protein
MSAIQAGEKCAHRAAPRLSFEVTQRPVFGSHRPPTFKAPGPALAQRFALWAKAIVIHNAQDFDVAKFLPPRDHSLEGFSFFETTSSH